MKGKFLVSALAVVMILTSVGVCFAESSSIQLRYITSRYITADISIDGAKANASVKVKPLEKNSLDTVAIDLSVINKKTNRAIKTWSKTLSMDSTSSFYYENSVKLTTKGQYYTKVIAKCYKGGKLIETINGESKSVTY